MFIVCRTQQHMEAQIYTCNNSEIVSPKFLLNQYARIEQDLGLSEM